MDQIPNAITLTRRIGNTHYRTRIHFSTESKATFEEKIMHLVQNEGLETCEKCDIMSSPQTSRQSERSAV